MLKRTLIIINIACFILSVIVAIVNSSNTLGGRIYSLYLQYLKVCNFDVVIFAAILSIINIVCNLIGIVVSVINGFWKYYRKRSALKLKGSIVWGVMLILSVVTLYLYLSHYIMNMV